MKNQQSSFRFDHREIAVVFSLFIFVSLLMFTVGILVGKGLQQAKYEGHGGPDRSIAHKDKSEAPHADSHHSAGSQANTGTSITTGDDAHRDPSGLDKEPSVKGAGHEEHASVKHDSHDLDTHAPPNSAIDEGFDLHDEAKLDDPSSLTEMESSLDLVPANPKKDKFAGLDEFPKTKESEKILNDPRMAKYLDGGAPSRSTASVAQGQPPKSFAHGKFTVQIGSYPKQREAVERIETLKKQGFPFAYYSAKEIEGKKGTWFRVWLGYFPDTATAKLGGDLLVSRGEVTSYFIRKSENEG